MLLDEDLVKDSRQYYVRRHNKRRRWGKRTKDGEKKPRESASEFMLPAVVIFACEPDAHQWSLLMAVSPVRTLPLLSFDVECLNEGETSVALETQASRIEAIEMVIHAAAAAAGCSEVKKKKPKSCDR